MDKNSIFDIHHQSDKDPFFVSDTHFNHKNIIAYCNRPFLSKEEMDEHLIKAWNDKVPPDGVVYHLGDVAFATRTYLDNLMPRLNGEKILILGNHDQESLLTPYFKATYRMLNIAIQRTGSRIVLCHYPIESWPGMHRGAIHLHGHCHGTLENIMPNRMDVGVDCHYNLEPFSLTEILRELKNPNRRKQDGTLNPTQ